MQSQFIWEFKKSSAQKPTHADGQSFVPDYAGVINPRQLVKAQITIAKELGCDVIDGHVKFAEKLIDTGTYTDTDNDTSYMLTSI